MKNHIKEAQKTFDFISYQVKRINQGKQIFDIKSLKNIINSESNNEIYESLLLLGKYINEFGDKTPKELNIIKVVELILNKSKELKPKSIEMTIGSLNGYTYSDVADTCLDILNDVKYLYPKEVLDLLIILSLDKVYEVKKKSLEVLSQFSQYNLQVLQNIGFYPQILILQKVEKWNSNQLIKRIDAVIVILQNLLNPSFEGHSMRDYKTFTLQFGPLKASEDLRKIRERTFILLKKLYSLAEDVKQKQKIIQTIQGLTRLPNRGKSDKDMEDMVLEDTNILIDYYISIIPSADNEIIKQIEEDIHWLPRRFDAKKLIRLEELKSLISLNKDYSIFRVFTGYEYYDTANEGEKEAEKIHWKEKRRIRQNKIQEFIDDISEENYKDWEQKILSVIKNYSFPESQGQFLHFNFFLNELGKQKPEIAYRFLIENEIKLEPFLAHIVAGIWESKLKESAKKLLSNWVKERKHLSASALVFDLVAMLDNVLINKIFDRAKEIKNKDIQNDTFNSIIRSVVKNYPEHKNTRKLFVNCIRELTKNKNWDWIFNYWPHEYLLLRSLTKTDGNTILANLLTMPNIRYPTQEILTPIAEKYPKKIIDFFYKRFLIQKEKKFEDYYDAIPYGLHELSVPLAKNAEIIIPEILKWFKKKDSVLHLEGRNLIKAIFPTFNEILERELIKLIKSKNEKNIRIVFNVLHAYEGEIFLHNICKELIKEYPGNDDYHRKIFHVLSQMGVVSGEYGFAEGFKKKKEEIQSWKKDKNKAIQEFVKKYEDYLNKRILDEKKQADETIELRKRQFNN
jgi:hypothetical protein